MAKPPASATKPPSSASKKVDSPKAAPPQAARSRTRVGPWFVAVAAVAAIVGGLIWVKASGLMSRDQAAAVMETRFSDIEQRLAAIEAELSASADAGQAAAAVAGDAAAGLAALDARLAEIEARPPPSEARPTDLGPLEDRLSVLEAAGQGGGKKELELAALIGRIAALEARPAIEATDPTPVATLLATAQLRAALRGSGPYDASLAALGAVAGDDDGVAAALAVLAPHAAAGIPTTASLRDRFEARAEIILRAAAAPPGGSWISRTLARLSGLVTVRRVGGDVTGDTAEAIVARAEAHLAAGDLAAAVGELEALDGAAAEAAASWLALAAARLAAADALAALDARAISALTNTAKSGG